MPEVMNAALLKLHPFVTGCCLRGRCYCTFKFAPGCSIVLTGWRGLPVHSSSSSWYLVPSSSQQGLLQATMSALLQVATSGAAVLAHLSLYQAAARFSEAGQRLIDSHSASSSGSEGTELMPTVQAREDMATAGQYLKQLADNLMSCGLPASARPDIVDAIDLHKSKLLIFHRSSLRLALGVEVTAAAL